MGTMTREEMETRKAEIEAEFASNLTAEDRAAWDGGDWTENIRDLMEKFSVEAWTLADDRQILIDRFRGGHGLNAVCDGANFRTETFADADGKIGGIEVCNHCNCAGSHADDCPCFGARKKCLPE